MTRNPDLNENSAEQAIPVGLNNSGGIAPQASSTIGVPAPPPQTIEAVGCSQSYTCLNPFGPDNRLDQGAIVFDLPQLVYGQYLDVDQQFEITDDMSPGSVIFQIPYHPISDYTNPFIKMYAQFHSRYNGDILFRIQSIGNATFSGTLMMFWYPERYPTSIVTFSEAQKYEYKTMSVVMPSVEAYVLRDARQYQYYREMSDGDLAKRPHLVMCIHTTVVSPLREGIKVRLRIGSKLASKTDSVIAGVPVQPFCLANPVLQQITPDNKVKSLNNMTLGQVFPYYSRRDLYGLIDGNMTLPSVSYLDSVGKIIDFSLAMPIPGLFGGDFALTEYKRLFLSETAYGTVEENITRIVYVVHQLDPDTEKAIATDPKFYEMLKDPATWIAKFQSAEAIQKYVTADVIRRQEAPVSIWTDPDKPATVLKMLMQTHMVTRKGMIVAFALEYHNSSRDYDAAKVIGVPNDAAGRRLRLPFNPVLGPVVHTGTMVPIPVPWFAFKMVDTPTTIVTGNDEVAPTAFTAPTIVEYFQEVTLDTTADQAFQFDLVDPTSKVRVMTLRYLPSLREFVINASDSIKYREYQGDLTKLLIANAGNIPLATSMPLTDTSNWPKRFPETQNAVTSTASSRAWFRQNAAFAAALGEMVEAESVAAAAETTFGPTVVRAGAGEISETSVTGATDPISRSSVSQRFFVNSEGSRWPVSGNIYSKRSTGSLTNNMYTFSRGTQYDQIGTSEGTQAGTSYSTTRSTPTQVWRPEQDKYTQMYPPEGRDRLTQTSKDTVDSYTQMYSPDRSVGTQTSLGTNGPRKNYSLETADTIAKYYNMIVGHTESDRYDRFVYMSSRNSMKVNGNALVSGEYQRHMQRDQNAWQEQQNDIQRRFQNEQNQKQFTHENEMQQHGFENQEELQRNTFAHDLDMQNRKFGQERTLQQNEFGFKNQYQQHQFSHDVDMSNLGFAHDLALGKQQIAGALLNTATGGAFSIASTAVSKAADAYLQQRNFHNQQSLMTQSFNQQLYASGASSQALRLAA